MRAETSGWDRADETALPRGEAIPANANRVVLARAATHVARERRVEVAIVPGARVPARPAAVATLEEHPDTRPLATV